MEFTMLENKIASTECDSTSNSKSQKSENVRTQMAKDEQFAKYLSAQKFF